METIWTLLRTFLHLNSCFPKRNPFIPSNLCDEWWRCQCAMLRRTNRTFVRTFGFLRRKLIVWALFETSWLFKNDQPRSSFSQKMHFFCLNFPFLSEIWKCDGFEKELFNFRKCDGFEKELFKFRKCGGFEKELFKFRKCDGFEKEFFKFRKCDGFEMELFKFLLKRSS